MSLSERISSFLKTCSDPPSVRMIIQYLSETYNESEESLAAQKAEIREIAEKFYSAQNEEETKDEENVNEEEENNENNDKEEEEEENHQEENHYEESGKKKRKRRKKEKTQSSKEKSDSPQKKEKKSRKKSRTSSSSNITNQNNEENPLEEEDDGFIVHDDEKEDKDDRIRTEKGLSDESQDDSASEERDDSHREIDLERRKGGKRKQILSDIEVERVIKGLINGMHEAFEKDVEAVAIGQPGVNKLKLIGNVEATLRNVQVQAGLDGHGEGFFSAMRLWLMPSRDGVLPNLRIRKPLLESLLILPFQPEIISSSKIGRVVNYLCKNDDNPMLRQLAQRIVDRWARPLFEVVDDYAKLHRDPNIQTEQRRLADHKGYYSTDINPQARIGDKDFSWHIRLPRPMNQDFIKVPESRITADGTAPNTSAAGIIAKQALSDEQKQFQNLLKNIKAVKPFQKSSVTSNE